MQSLLDQASSLITSESHDGDESNFVAKIADSSNKNEFCKSLESDIPTFAENGKTKEIGVIVRALKKSNASPNIRKILHYFAQAEAERGKLLIQEGSYKMLPKILNNIATAFRVANELDKIKLHQ